MKVFIKRDKFILVLSIFIGAVSAVASAFISIILQQILDIATKGDVNGFWQLCWGIMIYIVSLCLVGFAEAFCGKILIRNVTGDLRKRIFRSVMGQKPVEYYKCNSTDYLSAIVNDVKLLEENYLVPLLLSSQMIALFLSTLVILCFLSMTVTLILMGFLVLMFLVPILLGNALQKRQEAYSGKMAVFTSKAKDFLSGYEVIRGFNIGRIIQKKYQSENYSAVKAKFQADQLLAVNENLASMLSVLSTVIVVFTAAYMVMKGDITVGTLLALIQLSGTFGTPVLILMENIPKITGMKPILKRLGELSENLTEQEDRAEDAAPKFNNRLVLDNVTYAYEQNKNILDGLHLEIERGKKYAVLGESGCGKTTMIKLMSGYSRDYQGSIQYDGKEARDFSIAEFARLISVIHQNVYLFDTDLYQNISLDEEFTKKEWAYALEKSGVSQFLNQLENGLYSKVGENGNRLSGGQKQRVAVARALIRKTPILILDEGTSAVDKQTAYAIEKDLLEESSLTLITITHHMMEELRELYSGVIVMEKGKVNQL